MLGPLINFLNKQKPPRQFALSDFDRIAHQLKPCDVLLVDGRSRVSEVIRWLTNSTWTHAALYVGRLYDIEDEDARQLVSANYDGEPTDRLVVESLLGYGTVVRPLSDYQEDHLRVCRPARLSYEDSQQVVRYAVSRLGVDYDVRQIFDLARFLLPWSFLPRRWASTLFVGSKGESRRMKTVCSTMIAEAFGYVQFPILPLVKQTEDDEVQLFRRNPKLCTPSDFDYSPYFDIIKYSFEGFYKADYQLLPWKGTGSLTTEEMGVYLHTSEANPSVEEVEQAIATAIEANEAQAEDTPDVEGGSAKSSAKGSAKSSAKGSSKGRTKGNTKSSAKGGAKGGAKKDD